MLDPARGAALIVAMQQLWLVPPAAPPRPSAPAEPGIDVDGRTLPVVIKRNPRARHYLLSLRRDGSVRITVPRAGSLAEARRFALSRTTWLRRQLRRMDAAPLIPHTWGPGTMVLLAGAPLPLETNADPAVISLGQLRIPLPSGADNWRPVVEAFLQKRATFLLPPRVAELAEIHRAGPGRVSVRNQSSRWGSCSQRGTISLNWRLIQLPDPVRDYIIIHELMHLREMNHGPAFWSLVAGACPDYQTHERWLKEHAARLGM